MPTHRRDTPQGWDFIAPGDYSVFIRLAVNVMYIFLGAGLLAVFAFGFQTMAPGPTAAYISFASTAVAIISVAYLFVMILGWVLRQYTRL